MNAVKAAWYIYQLRRRFYHWNREELWRHQERRLKEILAYAQKNSPYYRAILKGGSLSIAGVPVMDKATMMEHFDRINTAGLSRDELVDFRVRQEREGFASLYAGRFSVGLSSGTSGNKVLTVLSREEQGAYACLLYARSGIPGSVWPRRVLFALRTNNPAFMEVTRFGITMVHVDYTLPPEELVQLINEKKCNILAGPPSLLGMLARQRERIRHKIDVLVSYAEVLEPSLKKELEVAFAAPLVEIYQGAEGFLGSTCRAGSLHLNEDVVYAEETEAGDPEGKIKGLLITDLYRTTQPIIRYQLNDLVEFSESPCACGSAFRVISRIHGRADDVLHLRAPDGTVRYLFPDYVCRAINQAAQEILEYQAIQLSEDRLEIRLVLKEGTDKKAIEEAVRRNLGHWLKKIGAGPVELVFTDTPPQKNPRSRKMIRVVRASR